VIDRPRVVKTERELWRVRVDPPIPTYEEDLSIRELIGEWILAERYSSERLEDLREGLNATVNIYGYNDPRAHDKDVFDSVDLTHEYIGEVALTPEAFPESPDPKAGWERDLDRIRRFIHEHGHSRVPERYYDEDGTRLDTVLGDTSWISAAEAVTLREVSADERVWIRGDVDAYLFDSDLDEVRIVLGPSDNTLVVEGSQIDRLLADGGLGDNTFEDRGEQSLKGIGDPVRVWAVIEVGE